jgi:hypothetical protein
MCVRSRFLRADYVPERMLSASTFCLRALLRLQHCNVPVIAGWLCPRAWLGAPYERLLSARALRLLYDLSLYGLIVSRSAFCPHVLLPFLSVWPPPVALAAACDFEQPLYVCEVPVTPGLIMTQGHSGCAATTVCQLCLSAIHLGALSAACSCRSV